MFLACSHAHYGGLADQLTLLSVTLTSYFKMIDLVE